MKQRKWLITHRESYRNSLIEPSLAQDKHQFLRFNVCFISFFISIFIVIIIF